MGKYLVLLVGVLFAGVLRLWTVDFAQVKIPFLSPAEAAQGLPESSLAIGTPSAITLPESDMATWFTPAEGADPDDPATWSAVLQWISATGTPAGWAEACKKAGETAGSERGTTPEIGALACSSDPTVTALQAFALELLAARAEVTLWLRGADGHDNGAVAGRLAEIRHSCENGLPSRLASEGSPYVQACTDVLAELALPADAEALRTAITESYLLVANDLATRDPSVDAEPPAMAAAASPEASPTPAP